MSVATNRFCKEHPDLVELCTSCIHEECPRGKCKQYRQMAERLKRESEERQKIADAEGSGTPEVLIKITAAIKALDELAAINFVIKRISISFKLVFLLLP